MKKNTFAKYNNKIYKISKWNKNQIRLISNDISDLNFGFHKKAYPNNYINKDSLPDVFFCDVEIKAIDMIYEITTKAIYDNCTFDLLSHNTNETVIGTSNSELAQKYHFDRTDKYYYELKVPTADINIMEERKVLYSK